MGYCRLFVGKTLIDIPDLSGSSHGWPLQSVPMATFQPLSHTSVGIHPQKKAGKPHIFALAICSHTSLTWNWTSGCRTFFILCIMNFLVSLGLLFAMLFSIWVSGVESSAWQTMILYKTFHRKSKDALSSFYSGLITWCPRLSFIRKQLHNFLGVSHS